MPLLEHYYSLASFAFILMGVFFSTVRWFHVCMPYQKQKDYYYPDRFLLTVFFLLPLLTFPYVLNPAGSGVWLLMKSFFPLTHLYVCAVLILNYFGTVKSWNKWKHWAYLMGVPIALLLLALFLNAVFDGVLDDDHQQILYWATVIVGALASAFCFYSIIKLMQWLKQFKESDYLSNPEDFPTVFAKKIVIIPIIEFVMVWGVFFFDSKMAMVLLNVIYVVLGIIFLLSVLHTHRKKSPSSWIDGEVLPPACNGDLTADNETSSTVDDASGLSGEKVSVIIGEIKAYVEGEKQFLNPHLSIVDVAEHCGYGRTYVSKVLTKELGGFFSYVNALRLEYAKKYREDHPYATQDEVATASGFSSRQTFYAVRRRMNQQ